MSSQAFVRSSARLSDARAAAPAGVRGCALIVDDEPANRRLLSLMLQSEGFRTLDACDGAEALACFAAERPDIVFMDVMMPEMDGFEATRQIKALAGLEFIPVIFLTALTQEHALMRCIQAGGDDFLSKPFSLMVLKARILAMERVRDLQRVIAAKQQALARLLDRDREEQALAERVLSRAVMNRNVATDRFALVQRSASLFNGDLVLTQYLPYGGLRLLVGDFTGHGLAAAIGALPVADIFHAMTRKGVDDGRVLAEINRRLFHLLPPDRFLAACLMTINGRGDELRWWNGGMPSAWLRDAGGLRELSPHALPLGILPELPALESPRHLPLRGGERLLLMSDGLLEATDREGRQFLDVGLVGILRDWDGGQPLLPTLLAALDAHTAGVEQTDDIAAMELHLSPELLIAPVASSSPPVVCGSLPDRRGGWSWSLELKDERMRVQPSLEAILRPLGLLEEIGTHLCTLETILAELYNNALDHGVLRLDSAIKSTPDGFDAYYRERERRLVTGCYGSVILQLTYEPSDTGGCVRLRVADSGSGFDLDETLAAIYDHSRPWGRGIRLVRELCETVTYRDHGSQVEAIYRW